MSTLDIPDEIRGKAVDALYAARDRGLDMHQAAACVLQETAPLVVAAELRRVAERLGEASRVEHGASGTDFYRGQAQGHADGEAVLLARADELGGQR